MGNKLGKVSALSIDPEVGVADMPLMLGNIYRIATTRAVDPHWMYRSHLAVGRSLRITAWLYVGTIQSLLSKLCILLSRGFGDEFWVIPS